MTTAKKHTRLTPRRVTNAIPNSLVKVVVPESIGKWISPQKEETFSISPDAQFPKILFNFDTHNNPPYKWKWRIEWNAKVSGLRESAKRGKSLRTFSLAGEFSSDSRSWETSLGQVVGGTLTVEVLAGNETFRRSVFIVGANPTRRDVEDEVSKLENTAGFAQLLNQESHNKNFINADSQPIVAFDGGYGMTQLTNPAPTYEQVWNWRANVKAGAALYQAKQQLAKSYLGQKNRTYTAEQLRLETWSRWNGGGYHTWDAAAQMWIRNANMLCDTKTGNIGWDTTEAENQSRSEQDLHARDASTYANPKKDKAASNKWKYSGVCYADHVSQSN